MPIRRGKRERTKQLQTKRRIVRIPITFATIKNAQEMVRKRKGNNNSTMSILSLLLIYFVCIYDEK